MDLMLMHILGEDANVIKVYCHIWQTLEYLPHTHLKIHWGICGAKGKYFPLPYVIIKHKCRLIPILLFDWHMPISSFQVYGGYYALMIKLMEELFGIGHGILQSLCDCIQPPIIKYYTYIPCLFGYCEYGGYVYRVCTCLYHVILFETMYLSTDLLLLKVVGPVLLAIESLLVGMISLNKLNLKGLDIGKSARIKLMLGKYVLILLKLFLKEWS